MRIFSSASVELADCAQVCLHLPCKFVDFRDKQSLGSPKWGLNRAWTHQSGEPKKTVTVLGFGSAGVGFRSYQP